MGFAADIRRFAGNVTNHLVVIPREATIRAFELATRTQPSVKITGGSFELGKVPVDTGELIGTCEVRVNGALAAVGKMSGPTSMPPDVRAALARMKPWDVVELIFTAPHAKAVEYGTGRMAGRFYVRSAIVQWERLVDQVAREFAE